MALNHNSVQNQKRDAYTVERRNKVETDKFYKRNVTFKLAETIEKMANLPDLGEWDSNFLKSICGKRNLSPKQRAVLNKIHLKHYKTELT